MQESQPNDRPYPGSLPDQERQCEIHGAYQAKHIFSKHWTRCDKCEQAREVQQIAERLKQQQLDKEERAKAILERNLRHSGLVGRFKSATFQTYIAKTPAQDKISKECQLFADTFDPCGGNALWVIGAPGTGKTHLGSAMVNHVIRVRGMGACIHGVHEIMGMLRARWGTRAADWTDPDAIVTTDDFLAHLGQIPLLVLDEIGVTRGTEDELKQLFCIIDERYRLERPTVLLSNLVPDEMKPVLGDRSYDRLREKAQMLVCNWKSVRA